MEDNREDQIQRDPRMNMLGAAVSPSPGLLRIENANNAWVRRLRLVNGPEEAARHARIGSGSLAAHGFGGPVETLELVAHVISWLFFFDDRHGEVTRDLPSLMTAVNGCDAVLRTGRLPRWAPPFEVALHDVRSELAARADAEWLQRFAGSMRAYFDGALLEHPHRRRGASPGLAEYRQLRCWSIGVRPMADLAEITSGDVLELDEWSEPYLVDLRDRACALSAWTNDLYSWGKERDPINVVSVIMRERSLDEEGAIAAAVDLHNAERREFSARIEQVRCREPSPPVRRYVAELERWVDGNLAWSRATARYHGAAAKAEHPELRA